MGISIFYLPNPLAATAVATNVGILPHLKSANACSRWLCNLAPCIEVVGKLFSDKNAAMKSAVRCFSTNTSVNSFSKKKKKKKKKNISYYILKIKTK